MCISRIKYAAANHNMAYRVVLQCRLLMFGRFDMNIVPFCGCRNQLNLTYPQKIFLVYYGCAADRFHAPTYKKI